MKCPHCTGGVVELFFTSKRCDRCDGAGNLDVGDATGGEVVAGIERLSSGPERCDVSPRPSGAPAPFRGLTPADFELRARTSSELELRAALADSSRIARSSQMAEYASRLRQAVAEHEAMCRGATLSRWWWSGSMLHVSYGYRGRGGESQLSAEEIRHNFRTARSRSLRTGIAYLCEVDVLVGEDWKLWRKYSEAGEVIFRGEDEAPCERCHGDKLPPVGACLDPVHAMASPRSCPDCGNDGLPREG